MTGCQCVTCLHARARADSAPGRRNLRPLISPAGVAPVASAEGATSSAVRPSPVPAALDALPRSSRAGVPGLPEPEPAARAAVGEPRLTGGRHAAR